MRDIVINDIKMIIRSRRFWIASAIIISLAFINAISQLLFQEIGNVGALGLFIFGNIYLFPLFNYVAPFIPALVFSPLFVGDIKTGAYRKAVEKIGLKKYLTARSVTALISGAGIFIVSHLIMLIVCFAVNPSLKASSVALFGMLSEVFYTSAPLYILIFVGYTALFGALFSFLSIGVGLVTKSYAWALVLPGILDFCATYLWPYFNNPFFSWVIKMLPSFLYNFDYPTDMWQRIFQMGGLLLLCVILVVIGYFKLKKQTAAETAAKAESGGHQA